MKFAPASKRRAKLRLAISGLAGGGKTFSALAIAQHILDGGRVAVIDTERGSASLYAKNFSFDVLELERFGPSDYIQALELAATSGYDVVVIDSLSHAWIDALEKVDDTVERGGGNNFTAWRKVSPAHNKLVDAILRCPMHVIATMRSKVEYAMQDNDRGKKEVKKVGLAPVQRSGVDYEFTIVGDIDLQHRMLISKSRADVVPVGEVIDRPGETFARRLRAWLDDGVEPIPGAAVEPPYTKPASTAAHAGALSEKLDEAFSAYLDGMRRATTLDELVTAATGPAKPDKGSPNHHIAQETYRLLRASLTDGATS